MKIIPDTLCNLRRGAFLLGLWLALAASLAGQTPTPVAQPTVSPASGPAPSGSLALPPLAGLPGQSEPTVQEIAIQVLGPQQIAREAVLAHISLQEKSPFNQELVAKSLNSLNATGLYSFVKADREQVPGGVRVIFTLVPKNRISAVVFDGNKEYSDSRLSNEIKTVAGDVLDMAQVNRDKNKLFEFYQKRGYAQVKIEPDVTPNENNGTAVVTFKITEGPAVDIESIEFVGNDHVDADTLRDLMDTSEYTFLISWITGSGVLKEETFLDDLAKLRQYYTDQGYLDVSIPADEVEYKYPAEDELVIVIHVHEGQQYHIGKINVSGNTIFQAETLLKQLKIKTGDVFSPTKVDAAAKTLRDFYGQSGYLDTIVNPVRRPEADDIGLNFTVLESEKFYVAGINIQGNTKTKNTVIVRELALAPGDVFDTVRMTQSEDRVKNLGYFNDERGNPQVNMAPEESNIPGKRNLSITVKEGQTGQVNFSAGFDTVQSFIGYVEYAQSNFDIFNYRNYFQGGGQKFRVRFTVGDQLNSVWISFEEPWAWQRELDVGIDLFRSDISYESNTFSRVDMGFDVYARKRIIEYIEGTLTYTLDQIQIRNVTANAPPQLVAEQGYRSVSKVGFGLQRVLINDLVMPTDGTRFELLNEVAGGPFLGQTNYYKIEGKAGWWYPLGKMWSGFEAGNQVFSVVARTGSIIGYGGKSPGYENRFFLGGGYNMRGYSLRNVGPKYLGAGPAYGQPIGGDSYTYASPEYSIEVFNPVRFAVFYDIGYVNNGAFDWSPTHMRHDVGFGLRILMLGAPMRLDVGYPLNPDVFQSHSFQFNFSFGTVF